MTHDYKRHGTIAVFDILEGKVTGRCMQRHRASGVHPVPERRRARGPAAKSVRVCRIAPKINARKKISLERVEGERCLKGHIADLGVQGG